MHYFYVLVPECSYWCFRNASWFYRCCCL